MVATLSTAEVDRIRMELGWNVLSIGAEPYIGHARIFDIIQQNVQGASVAATTASTAVTAAGVATITLASVSGLSAQTRVQLDTDAQRETCTIIAVSGSAITVLCRKTHGSAYLVEVESALTLVRGLLSDLSALEQVQTLDAFNSLGLKQVDEVVWRDGEKGLFDYVNEARESLRGALARACGIPTQSAAQRGRSSAVEVY